MKETKADLITYFRLDDIVEGDIGNGIYIPRIGDVVEFELAQDVVLTRFLFARNLICKEKGGILADTGVVDTTKENRYGFIKSYKSKYRSIQFEFVDVQGDNITLKEGDEVEYRLVPLREKKKSRKNLDGEDVNEEFLAMRAVDVKLIKAAPEFHKNRQRINQSLLQKRLNTGGAKGGLVVSRVAKAPNEDDNGFSDEYQKSRSK